MACLAKLRVSGREYARDVVTASKSSIFGRFFACWVLLGVCVVIDDDELVLYVYVMLAANMCGVGWGDGVLCGRGGE